MTSKDEHKRDEHDDEQGAALTPSDFKRIENVLKVTGRFSSKSTLDLKNWETHTKLHAALATAVEANSIKEQRRILKGIVSNCDTALSPTSSARSGESTVIADIAAIRSVTRPRASVTRSLVRTGSRLPRRTPTVAPASTVKTLTSEARPGNKRGSCGEGGRAQSRASGLPRCSETGVSR